MEISDDLLRSIVREVMQELDTEAEPALVRKLVKEVLRRLDQREKRTPFQIAPQPSHQPPS